MKKSRYSKSLIISILNKNEQGMKVRDICREHGISDATFYNWKAKYGGLSVSELARIKELERENSRLKRMYADLSLVYHAVKKAVNPDVKWEMVILMREEHQISIRQGCKAVGLPRSSYCYQHKEKNDQLIIDWLLVPTTNTSNSIIY